MSGYDDEYEHGCETADGCDSLDPTDIPYEDESSPVWISLWLLVFGVVFVFASAQIDIARARAADTMGGFLGFTSLGSCHLSGRPPERCQLQCDGKAVAEWTDCNLDEYVRIGRQAE